MSTHLYVCMGAGEGDGIMAAGDSERNMRPMVTLDPEVAEIYAKAAKEICRITGRRARLVKFVAVEVVQEFGP